MNCEHGTCLQESLGERIAHFAGQWLHDAWVAIAQAAMRRQRYRELRTRAVNFALEQRLCCRNLLTRQDHSTAAQDQKHA